MNLLSPLCYGLVLLFGIGLSACFAGIPRTRKTIAAVLCFFLLALTLQCAVARLFGFETAENFYPLIVHLPLLLFLTLCFRCPWAVSAASVLSGYLCCQIPRWIAALGSNLIPGNRSYYLFYMLALGLCFWLMVKYVAGPVHLLLTQSKKECLLFGMVPLFYYLFDYATTVYTDWLYSGVKAAVQFMPSVVSIFYFVFLVIYFGETEKQTVVRQERDLATAQLRQATAEIASFRQMQANAAAYRHDMRHHFTLLQGMAAEGNLDQIRSYLHTAQRDLDSFTPVRYCTNEIVNLILSSFSDKAAQAGVTLSISVELPASLPLHDTELCSLFSNGLENAIKAAANCHGTPVVQLHCKVHKDKFLLLIENPYSGRVEMQDGLPLTRQENHGFGVKSICMIAEGHGGMVTFEALDGTFTLRVLLPLYSAREPQCASA